MEHLRVCPGAQTADVDPGTSDTGGLELIDVGTPEIEMGLASGRAPEPSIHALGIVPRLHESRDHFLPHLAAARTERRSDGDREVLRPRAITLVKRADSGWCNPPHGAAPARMNRGDHAQSAVRDQDRSAVGHAHD